MQTGKQLLEKVNLNGMKYEVTKAKEAVQHTVISMSLNELRNKILVNPNMNGDVNFVDENEQQSGLIERLIMGCTSLSAIGSKTSEWAFSIDYGLPELTAVYNFMDNKFSLANLSYIPSLYGLKFNELPDYLQAELKNLRVKVTLVNNPDTSFLFGDE